MTEIKKTGNKGEWSELYAFLWLLAKGRIYAADDHAERIESVYYSILKIFREETRGNEIDYIIDGDDVVVETYDGKPVKTPRISRSKLEQVSEELFEEIKAHKKAFELKNISDFVYQMGVTKIKAPSWQKADIMVQIHDVHSGFDVKDGFSIKSEVGAAPTLINPGESTNFIYKVEGLSKEQVSEINSVETRDKIKQRMAKIGELGGTLKYYKPANRIMNRNLIMVDGDMPKIIGEMLLYSFVHDIHDCETLINALGQNDPLEYGEGETVIYESKFKRFLYDCALGMTPATYWDGTEEANGGYIIVKTDGDIVAYTLYNRDAFMQYLFENTTMERASTTRYKYMKIYTNEGNMFIKLNLQIRFKKINTKGN